MYSLPGRPSDAGPDGRKCCPACGSSQWDILTDCMDCHAVVCDRCPGAEQIGTSDVLCADCSTLLHLDPITARPVVAKLPEWDRGAESEDALILAATMAIAAGLEIEEQERAAELRLLAMAGCTEREARAAMSIEDRQND